MRPLVGSCSGLSLASFFAAGRYDGVLRLVDPLELRDLTFPHMQITRSMGYTIGFFMFWLATASSSLFTWLLLRPASRFNKSLPPE